MRKKISLSIIAVVGVFFTSVHGEDYLSKLTSTMEKKAASMPTRKQPVTTSTAPLDIPGKKQMAVSNADKKNTEVKSDSNKTASLYQDDISITLRNGEVIKTDKNLSLALLAFQKEEELLKEKEKAEKKRKEAAAKLKESEQKCQERIDTLTMECSQPPKHETKNTPSSRDSLKNYPSLEEQMMNFKKELATEQQEDNHTAAQAKTMPLDIYYGIICKSDKCFVLGANRIYKVGDFINGNQIKKIDKNYIEYTNHKKEWFTR